MKSGAFIVYFDFIKVLLLPITVPEPQLTNWNSVCPWIDNLDIKPFTSVFRANEISIDKIAF